VKEIIYIFTIIHVLKKVSVLFLLSGWIQIQKYVNIATNHVNNVLALLQIIASLVSKIYISINIHVIQVENVPIKLFKQMIDVKIVI
jgi:hypothetical protein